MKAIVSILLVLALLPCAAFAQSVAEVARMPIEG